MNRVYYFFCIKLCGLRPATSLHNHITTTTHTEKTHSTMHGSWLYITFKAMQVTPGIAAVWMEPA